jgi:predicted O-methyltransferase YrrM
MNISNFERLKKLTANLLSNPDLIYPYVSKSLMNKKMPLDYALPWWSFRAIEYADTIFLDKKMFEFGTGGSTIRYANVCKSITSVEDSKDWLAIVQDRLTKINAKNNKLIFRAFDFDSPVDFAASAYLESYNGQDEYDVVVIDGQDKSFKERLTCFRHVEPTIKEGAVIVMDDWWRYTELLKSNRAKAVKVFESVGPCRYGVTSTAFFHY